MLLASGETLITLLETTRFKAGDINAALTFADNSLAVQNLTALSSQVQPWRGLRLVGNTAIATGVSHCAQGLRSPSAREPRAGAKLYSYAERH